MVYISGALAKTKPGYLKADAIQALPVVLQWQPHMRVQHCELNLDVVSPARPWKA